jgi:hypothetical protein
MRVIIGSTREPKVLAASQVGTKVVRDFNCVEFNPGIATPVPFIRISSTAKLEDNQKYK